MNGTCTCDGGPQCTGAETCCPGLGCRDLSSDAAACGSCGKACNSFDELCCSGNCIPRNNSNCGSCGNSCGFLTSCCVCGSSSSCTTLLCLSSGKQ
jgi:hypothetical protein